MYYVNYFKKSIYVKDSDMPEYVKELKTIIEEGIKAGKTNPDLQVKYGWMKNKYNLMVAEFTNSNFIETLTDAKLISFYTSLKRM